MVAENSHPNTLLTAYQDMEEEAPKVEPESCEARDAEPDNDVVIVGGTIPEVIISDNSCDNSAAFGNLSAIMEETSDIEIKKEQMDCDQEPKAKSDEENFADFIIIDDDSPPIIKTELTCKSADCVDKQDNPLPDCNVVKSELKVKALKIETKPKPSTPKIESVGTNPDITIKPTPRSSLSNETFVLQLDTTDALDSYLVVDKTLDKQAEVSATDNMKENDSNQLNVVAPTKAPEPDSLILTADEELETEMTLTDKNEKVQNKPNETDAEIPKTTEEAQKEADDVTEKPKNESADADIKKDDPAEMKPISVSPDKIKSESKKLTAGKKSDTSRILWVSNVTQSVKATDLKQYISKVGKVMTAKVVTDGKKCYGYVVMEDPEDANACLKTLNNAYFEGKKISLSLTRPPKSTIPDKGKDTKLEKEEEKCNETDDVKVTSKPPKSDAEKSKRRRSPSRSRSDRVSKRRKSNDPLTTKFEPTRRRAYRPRSRSSDRHMRERIERERMKRRLVEEQRRHKDEMIRQMQREEKHREMEFRLEQERRKLQLERELFERERRELARLDAERRKIEKERLEVLQQRSKLEEEFQKSRLKRKSDEFNLCSTIVKPPETIKAYDKRKELPKSDDYRKYDKPDPKHQFQKKDVRDERKNPNDAKNSAASNHRNALKPNDFKSTKDVRDNSKGAIKNYERAAPPPPKLNNDFDLTAARKAKHSEHKKSDRGRKIEVIDRKYYAERGNNEATDRRHERVYRKPEFPERKFEYGGREVKRYREEGFPERENTQRTQWSAPVNYNNDPWKPMSSTVAAASAPVRYQEGGNFSAPSYGGPSRITPFYYHPTPQVQEYPRYDHCPQVTGRKY